VTRIVFMKARTTPRQEKLQTNPRNFSLCCFVITA
jgi:hypothetical protein